MSADARDWGEDWLRDAANDRWTQAAEHYEQSDAFTRDAIEWLTDAPAIPDDVMAVVCGLYRESDRFATVVEDLSDGEFQL